MEIQTLVKRYLPKRKRDYVRLTLVVLVILFVMRSFGNEVDTKVTEAEKPLVTVASINSLISKSNFSTVGKVESLSEANLKTETGGQVTGVFTDIGKFVTAGTIIAQFDNGRERAALLQAEGAYEAAEAVMAGGDIGAREAETDLINAITSAETSYSSAYQTVNNLLQTEIDDFFSNPESTIIGLKINGYSETTAINEARRSLEILLPLWSDSIADKASFAQKSEKLLSDSIGYTDSVVILVDKLLVALNKDTGGNAANQSQVKSNIDSLTGTRDRLIVVRNSLVSARTNVTSATDALERAKLSASNTSGPSATEAQVKQALGSLRAAQTAYEKTLVRTPISGVVNVLNIKRGDYISPLTDVAKVANSNGLQVVAAVSDNERDLLLIGDVVTINKVATGTITAIAGGVDSATGKVAIKISINNNADLSSGETVTVDFQSKSDSTVNNSEKKILIPLTAVKLSSTNAFVFVVNESNQLVAVPVTLGIVSGDDIEIISGLTSDMSIVIDVRGLKAGEVVDIAS